jgi:hypothetical protein
MMARLVWYQSDGATSISTIDGTAQTSDLVTTKRLSVSAIAPDNAGYVSVRFRGSGGTWTVGETQFVDNISLYQDDSGIHSGFMPPGWLWTIAGTNWWWSNRGADEIGEGLKFPAQYVYFPGTAGNYASTPDSAALSITGDIDIRAKIAMDTWGAMEQDQAIVAKWLDSTQRSYMLRIRNGNIRCYFSTTGADVISGSGNNAIPTDGSVKWVRVTRASATGLMSFYTSEDGVTWTATGTATGTAGALFDSTQQVEVGSYNNGAGRWAGKVYYAEIRNGIGGSVVGDFTPNVPAHTGVRTPSTFTSAVGAVPWTLNGSAWEWYPTVSPIVSTPDTAVLDVTGDLDIRIKVTADDWTARSSRFELFGKYDSTGNQRSFMVWINSGGSLTFWHSETGTVGISANSTASLTFANGATGWVRVTLDVDNGSAGHSKAFYTSEDGVTWTQLGTTVVTAGVTSVHAGTAPLVWGARHPTSNLESVAGVIHYAELRSGINGSPVAIFDPDVARLPAGQTPLTIPSLTGEVYTISGGGWEWDVPGTVDIKLLGSGQIVRGVSRKTHDSVLAGWSAP